MASRRRRKRRNGRTGGASRIVVRAVLVVIAVALVMSTAGVAAGGLVVQSWLQNLPDYTDPAAFKYAEATRIYSADGTLLAKFYLENRTVVPLSKISTGLAEAVVAVEDERFYQHQGVDPVGILRALTINLKSGDAREGASTITQQYIRNTLLLDERTDITLARKIREAYLATQFEKAYTKDQILEMYLNTIYFGEGAYGAQAAAQTFFGKSAARVTLPEAALLAGLPQQPSRLSPFTNPKGAVQRRNQVLKRMYASNKITKKQYDKAVKTKLKLHRQEDPLQGIYAAPYFVSHVRKWLLNKYPQAVVFKGGLKVYTTLDMDRQRFAEMAVRENLNMPGDPEGALVSVDPRTGHVVALVGGRSFKKSKFNLATQGSRQPGSSFKTFTLTTAIDQGVAPWTKISSSSPALIPTKPTPWVVSNSEGEGRGNMSLDAATWHSVNTVFARLTWEIGARKVAATAKKMGITTPMQAYPSITLGTHNVSPLEMASAYGTLAANGVHRSPVLVTRIVNSKGKTIYKNRPKSSRAVNPKVAGKVTQILEGVITRGTARRAYIGRPAAGKTGTSQNYRDAWFVGYTPQLVTAVWVGYPTERPMLSVHGGRGFGGTLAAPIWASFMNDALKGEPVMRFRRFDDPEWSHKYHFPQAVESSGTSSRNGTGTTTPKKSGSGTGNSGSGSTGGSNNGSGKSGGGTKPPPPPPPPTDTSGTAN